MIITTGSSTKNGAKHQLPIKPNYVLLYKQCIPLEIRDCVNLDKVLVEQQFIMRFYVKTLRVVIFFFAWVIQMFFT